MNESGKRSLVFGPGQDGSYLVDLLLERGDTVHVFHRHSSVDNLARIRHCLDRVTLHRGDVTDLDSVQTAVNKADPHEIYNVADQDNIAWSFAAPDYQRRVTHGGARHVMMAAVKHNRDIRVFQPLSCTMFGNAPPPQDEYAPVDPKSPYAREKSLVWNLVRSYRDKGLFVAAGIMFNHDSPRRAPGYLLQSVCSQAVEVAAGRREKVTVGHPDARVDVGYARDYMTAAIAMLKRDVPDDYCVGTGEARSVRLMVDWALNCAGFGPTKENAGRIGVDEAIAPGPQPTYRANVDKARRVLGWEPTTDVGSLINMLVRHFQQENP